MIRTIKAGDSVRCIDDSATFNKLHMGGIYIAENTYDGTIGVIVNGSFYSINRFVKA